MDTVNGQLLGQRHARIAVWIFLALILSNGDVSADGVILVPGVIEGTVVIGSTSETNISRCFISAHDVGDPNLQSYANFYPDPQAPTMDYSLTVDVPEGAGADYQISARCYTDNGSNQLQFPPQIVNVSETVPGYADFILTTPGFIEGTVTANGGSGIRRLSMYAYQPAGSPAYSSHLNLYPQQADPSQAFFRFPVYPNTGVRLSEIRVYLVGGESIEVEDQEVDVPPGDTVVVDFEVNTQATGSIEGDIAFMGNDMVDHYSIKVSGSINQSFYFDPPFEEGNLLSYALTGIPGGTIDNPATDILMEAYADLHDYDDRYYFPDSAFIDNNQPPMISGETTYVDILADQAYLTGTLSIFGTVSNDDLDTATIYIDGIHDTSTYGGAARDKVDVITGEYDAVVSPGDWMYSYFNLEFYREGDPDEYLHQSTDFHDYQKGQQDNAVTLAAAGNTRERDFSYKTGSVVVTFHAEGGATFSNPQLQGYCYQYENSDGTGQQLGFYTIASDSPGQVDVTEGRVTMVGMEGLCTLNAIASVDGVSTTFGVIPVMVIPGVTQDRDIDGPSLTVALPEPDVCTDVTSVDVIGLVSDDAGVESVTVNGAAATLTSTGNLDDPNEMSFGIAVPLENGENTIVTTAVDLHGNTSSDLRIVVIDSTDDDSDGVTDCIDNCLGEYNPEQTDGDGDGVGQACESCDADPDKTAPGECGCGVADFDTDGDGVLDCFDECPTDPEKTAPGGCGCGFLDIDSDGDQVADCVDGCPYDSAKGSPGVCGCGVIDDEDGDGYASCEDDCDDTRSDINPGEPEACDETDHNCDGDIDDGLIHPYPLCLDLCPDDDDKTEPGICGCGIADTDSDADGTADCDDLCPDDPYKTDPGECDCGVADVDGDGDTVFDCNDNCVDIINPGQHDADTDGEGDACDDCPLDQENDLDNDGICGNEDNCPGTANADQEDLDGDDIGDACDGDLDGDGVDNEDDNCAWVSNAGQDDADLDEVGDACDDDVDGDGVPNDGDACELTALNDIVDPDSGCSIDQTCPCDGPWKNHGKYVSCVAHVTNEFVSLGLITETEKGIIQSEAAQSDCGDK